jgi:chemotaxis protein methyltransferase CheR
MSNVVESGEFVMTARDFSAIAGIMMEEAGIALADNKVNLVYSRLAKRLRALGLDNFAAYCKLVASGSPSGQAERGEMVAALTTNVTRFFREPHHFEHLKSRALPGLIAQAKRGVPVRLWSSACSTGPEPYSMALTLLSVFPDAAKYDVKILATDIDPNVLKVAQAGIYEAAALEPVPAELRSRWFLPAKDMPGMMQAAIDLRALITFRKMNLIGQWPMRGRFHIVFCRNVVIYFDADTQARIWSRMAPLLEPGGILYIGHSERVSGPAEAALKSDGITIYRRDGGREPAGGAA